MLMDNNHVTGHSRSTDSQNKRQTLWHRSRRQRESRAKSRRKPTRLQPTGIAASFEQALYPKLSGLFKHMFLDLPFHEREDAHQDCICQFWLMYKRLPAPIAARIPAEQLAERVYRAYQNGRRFLALETV